MDATVNDDSSSRFDWHEDRAENGYWAMKRMSDLTTAAGELRVGEGKKALLNELVNNAGDQITAEKLARLIELGDKIEEAAGLISKTYNEALRVMDPSLFDDEPSEEPVAAAGEAS
jgi:hypothetical protein